MIKICGITNPEDARAAVECGADALGFIFHAASPRYIAPDALAQWVGEIPSHIVKVGVFVDRPRSQVEDICSGLKLDVAQLHGSEQREDVPQGVRVWKAARVTTGIDAQILTFPAEAIVLDGPASGQSFDWQLARGLGKRVVLAGGLDCSNVAHAIAAAEPWGVDACSSLEASPGKKDHIRMARFIHACQNALSLSR